MDKNRRIFSQSFKEEKVAAIERGTLSVVQLSREYEVSQQAIYRWLYKYSLTRKKGSRMVIELESESYKTNILEKQVAELQRLLGQKEVEIAYLNKVIESGNELLKCDLKKKLEPKS